jgi:type II secretory pathway component GspD/PulD (secretin)
MGFAQDVSAQDRLEDKSVSNIFLSTDIHQALTDVAKQVDIPILVGSDVEGTVTLRLDNTPLPKAMDMMLASGGYVWRQINGYILVGSSAADSPLFAGLSETRRVKLSNVQAEAALEMISPSLRSYAAADAELNRIIITAPTMIADRILADLEDIDQPAMHVLLEARVVVLERDALLDLGVEWDFPTIEVGTINADSLQQRFPVTVSVGMTQGGAFTESLMMSLNFLEQNEEATIVSHPQLTVRDGRAAEMAVMTEEFFQIESRDNIDLKEIASGTRLNILPQIGADGKITLTMNIEVSEVVGRTQRQGGDEFPIVTRRTAQSTVQVVSGGTAAISGLMESRTDMVNRRVPGAVNMPLVGKGFNNDTSIHESKQVAVFVTATIVEKPLPHQVEDPSLPAVDEEVFRDQIRQVLNASYSADETSTP